MTDFQWGVYRADLNPAQGSEQFGLRPVLVVSRESINRALPVVAVCPLTSRKAGRRIYPTEFAIPAGQAGLKLESLVLAHQIRTLAKERLKERLGTLDDETLRRALRLALALFLDLESQSDSGRPVTGKAD